jgi:hypothetical protein
MNYLQEERFLVAQMEWTQLFFFLSFFFFKKSLFGMGDRDRDSERQLGKIQCKQR